MSEVKRQEKRKRGHEKPTALKEIPTPSKSDEQETGDKSFETLRDQIEARFKDLPKQKTERLEPAKQPKVSKKTRENLREEAVSSKKRDRNGDLIVHAKAQSKKATQTPSVDEDFESEVKALGGTSEDIALIADADSDSEVEGDMDIDRSRKQLGKSQDIQRGISNILKEITLSQGIAKASEGSDQESEEAEVSLPAENGITVNHSKKVSEPNSNFKMKGLRCEPRPDWFAHGGLDVDLEKTTKYTPSLITLEKVQAYARSLLDDENEAFRKTHQSSSSQSFYNTVIASGTLSDKISALTLAVQESPVHNVRALETLITLSKKRSRSQAVDVLRALKDLFAQGSLLPSTRRLYAFTGQPALLATFGTIKSWKSGDQLPKGVKEEHLIFWTFESWLKEQYFEVLKTLEVWCNDEIEFSKARALSYVYELLKEKPEQESNLLRLLINKLGDPSKKIASQTSYLLMQLLAAHPAMKNVVVSAIETDFMFRPSQSLHGKYYATVTLNQTALSSKEEDVAIKLLDIYFSLFTGLLKNMDAPKSEPEDQPLVDKRRKKKSTKPVESGQAQSDELKEKLTSAILTGVNRAYPYAGSDNQSFTQHLDTLFKVAHSANFNTGIQAMLLIQQLSSSHQPSSDRFYRILYESLLDPRLLTASKQQLYLNLVHRALKADLNMKRVKAFIKRLLQALTLHEPSFICGVFFLLKDLEKTFPALTSLVDQAEDHDTDEEVFRDVIENDDGNPTDQITDDLTEAKGYDGHKRAPEHANADNACAWEVLPFLAHFHPSVSLSAESYLQHAKLAGKPDLTLHTLIHFLDRFVYRNAKLPGTQLRGSSIMQPMATDNAHAVLLGPTAGGNSRFSVNSEEFRSKKDGDVAAEDVFFHKYFSSLGKESVKKSKKSDRQMDSDGSGDEDEVWKAMMDSAPDLEGNDSDDDMSMSDLESELGHDSEDAMDYDNGGPESDDDEVDIEAGIFDESENDLLEVGDLEGSPAFEGIASDEERVLEETETPDKKAKKAKKEQRKKAKSLPTFASAAEYARMLDDEQDEDLG